jgi:hypothetical protein
MRVVYRLYGQQPRKCHNCSCGTKAVEKLTRYPTRIGTIPTEGHRSTSWRSIPSTPPLVQRTCVSRQSACTHAVLRVATSTPCRWVLSHKILWTDEEYFTGEGVFNVHCSRLWLRDNTQAIIGCLRFLRRFGKSRVQISASATSYRHLCLMLKLIILWTPYLIVLV